MEGLLGRWHPKKCVWHLFSYPQMALFKKRHSSSRHICLKCLTSGFQSNRIRPLDFLALFISRENARIWTHFSREMREKREMREFTNMQGIVDTTFFCIYNYVVFSEINAYIAPRVVPNKSIKRFTIFIIMYYSCCMSTTVVF